MSYSPFLWLRSRLGFLSRKPHHIIRRHQAIFPVALLGAGFLLLVIFLADKTIQNRTESAHSSDLIQVPDLDVAVILGCSEYLSNGRKNLYFSHRIAAALELYDNGRCRTFLVSGDNGRHSYNEPEAMKQALIRGGIPAEQIYCDFAGFRTLDSVVRAKKVFGIDRFIIVSQRFHNERAIYLAQKNGIDAFGYNAQDVHYRGGLKTRLREKLARVKTVLDVTLLDSQPKFLGTRIPIRTDGG
ncbi:MAG: ElyC/SanA/YdcF family protein [Verrucomicrobiales bacterium]|nr:ElyC/SanA/YdcF family protein [Verrucomicrobiales bacterium]